MLNVKDNKKLVQEHIFKSTEKVVTLKDLLNIADHDKDKINAVSVNTLLEEMKKVDGKGCKAMAQLRCNFTLTHEQFTYTLMGLLVVCALLPTKNSHARLLDDLKEYFPTRLHMLVLGIMS